MCHATTVELEAPTVVRTGTMLTYSCKAWSAVLAIDFDLRCNQLRLSMDLGDFAFTSEWQEVRKHSEEPRSAQLILEALERWQVLFTTQPGERPKNLKLMSAMGLAWETLEHVLESWY